jgi:hypothetical protein
MPALSAPLSSVLFQMFLPNHNGKRRVDECILPTESDIADASNRVSDRVGARRKI